MTDSRDLTKGDVARMFTSSEGEEENCVELFAHFESELDELIYNTKKEALKIGGSFRAPAICRELNSLLRNKLNTF